MSGVYVSISQDKKLLVILRESSKADAVLLVKKIKFLLSGLLSCEHNLPFISISMCDV